MLANDKKPADPEFAESFYNPHNIDSYLKNDRYHHSKKGCIIDVNQVPAYSGFMVNKYCQVHKKICSKSGWELGWYQGTESKQCWGGGQHLKNCEICQNEYITSSVDQRYCSNECRKVAHAQRRYEKTLKANAKNANRQISSPVR